MSKSLIVVALRLHRQRRFGNLSACIRKGYAGRCHRVRMAGSASLVHVVETGRLRVCESATTCLPNRLLKLDAFNLAVEWLIIASNLNLVGEWDFVQMIGRRDCQLTPWEANGINLPASAMPLLLGNPDFDLSVCAR